MIDTVTGGIIRLYGRIANSATIVAAWSVTAVLLMTSPVSGQTTVIDHESELTSFVWDFSRRDDTNFNKFPDRWERVEDIGYPKYVIAEITARDTEFERRLLAWDTQIIAGWTALRKSIPTLPKLLPPSLADSLTDRYLRIDLDGGQFAAQSAEIPASRRYQYRFSCEIATRGLVYDSALAEFAFLNDDGKVIESHSTKPLSGTNDWTTMAIPPAQPPYGATQMLVRLKVQRGDDGLEDIRGRIGFDNIRIERLPQLAVTTDKPLGAYRLGQPVTASAKIMGLPKGQSEIRFVLLDSSGSQISEAVRRVEIKPAEAADAEFANNRSGRSEDESIGTAVSWQLPALRPGFYRIGASIHGRRVATLASEITFAVIDQLTSGPPHGCFGWTLPQGRQDVLARDVAPWLADYGVAWIKYPCWLAPEDLAQADETAVVFSRLQDRGIETIGMLDVPPESQQSNYELRGRRDLVAAQLFRNQAIWNPLLEPVMSRMTLKVRRWQLGADRDHSFLGRPRLNESITQISTGLQGFGQPIDVAISWPWEESQYQDGKSSWQAECRSSDPPLSPRELDAYLSLRALDTRPQSPNTWLLIDPIARDRYSQTARIQDLVLRMATVRGHRVQAAFISNPRDPNHGLLRRDGRPDELLLPWRTTSRLIGNLRKAGSLKLRNGTDNMVFTGDNRAVLLLWAPVPGEERLFLGADAQVVDVWGKVADLPIEFDGNQPTQVVPTGPEPVFVIGADPSLLAFRMSVALEPDRLDSLIGRNQKLSISLSNPIDESLVGDLRIMTPASWSIESPKWHWQSLAGRSASHTFDVGLTNTAMIGDYEVPIQFDIDSVPPKRITVYRHVVVGPEGIDVSAKTRLMPGNELQVQIQLTNRRRQTKSFDCILFPPPGRQFQERVISVAPGETVRRDFYWPDAERFLGGEMTLRAVEQDGPRVINFKFKIRG